MRLQGFERTSLSVCNSHGGGGWSRPLRHGRARMGSFLSSVFLSISGLPVWGFRCGAGWARAASPDPAVDVTADKTAEGRAWVKAEAAGGGGRRPALTRARPSATLALPELGASAGVGVNPDVMFSSPRRVKRAAKRHCNPIQGWSRCLRPIPACKLVSGGARSSIPLCSIPSGTGARGTKATGPILTAAFQAIARRGALSPWSGSKEASIALLLI